MVLPRLHPLAAVLEILFGHPSDQHQQPPIAHSLRELGGSAWVGEALVDFKPALERTEKAVVVEMLDPLTRFPIKRQEPKAC